MTNQGPPGPSVQEQYAPHARCWGCGPVNGSGLGIRSFRAADGVGLVAVWTPGPDHLAFEGVLNGGIIGTLLDCHSNWTASIGLMDMRGLGHPPTCVTAEYAIRLRRPTPTDGPVRLVARIVELSEDRATVEAELVADGRITATCRGRFIAVPPGHPAYDSW